MILVDIPRSIEQAQGSNSTRHLASCPPLQTAYLTNDPKSAKARSKLGANSVGSDLHESYAEDLHRALDAVKSSFKGDWCLPRCCDEGASAPATKKRKVDPEPLVQPNREAYSSALQCTRPGLMVTSDPVWIDASCRPATDCPGYLIPHGASFQLSDCKASRAFHANIRSQAEAADLPRHFDFILLDPPWPNRSVKRTHKTPGSTYATSPTLRDVRKLILGTDLDMLMAENCLIAIWITNKAAIRDIVLGSDGIFACWGIELVEEWLWLKTTVHGEPVTPLGGVWRKPYEVLLLGRRRRRAGDTQMFKMGIKRRVIVAVPDLHSRKPCLKELIEPLLPGEARYRALEVFSRYLVEGWWSWGDECIKFNHEDCWRDPDASIVARPIESGLG